MGRSPRANLSCWRCQPTSRDCPRRKKATSGIVGTAGLLLLLPAAVAAGVAAA